MFIACQQPKSKLIIEENIVWLQIKSLPSGNSFRAIVWKSKKCTKEELEKKNGKTKRREADWLKGANHRTYCSLYLPLSLALFLSLYGSNNNNRQTRVYAYVGNLHECVGARETKEVPEERWGGQGTGYKLQLSGYFVLQWLRQLKQAKGKEEHKESNRRRWRIKESCNRLCQIKWQINRTFLRPLKDA